VVGSGEPVLIKPAWSCSATTRLWSFALPCMARTRLYRHGVLEAEGLPVAEVSDHVADRPARSGLM
jgi:hypothetical protein